MICFFKYPNTCAYIIQINLVIYICIVETIWIIMTRLFLYDPNLFLNTLPSLRDWTRFHTGKDRLGSVRDAKRCCGFLSNAVWSWKRYTLRFQGWWHCWYISLYSLPANKPSKVIWMGDLSKIQILLKFSLDGVCLKLSESLPIKTTLNLVVHVASFSIFKAYS